MIFQTMTFVKSNNISLKYQRFTTLGSKDNVSRKSEFVAKTQFLYPSFNDVLDLDKSVNLIIIKKTVSCLFSFCKE